jgi:hypothetical protein
MTMVTMFRRSVNDNNEIFLSGTNATVKLFFLVSMTKVTTFGRYR